MDRINDILNNLNDFAKTLSQKTYDGKKRNDLKDTDFLFPETRSFPIVVPKDIKDAIRNFGRMDKKMSYDTFIKKLYHFAEKKGPEFINALPQATKKKLGLEAKSALWDLEDFSPKTMVDLIPESAETTPEEDYREEFLEMSITALLKMKNKAEELLKSLDANLTNKLTTPWVQRKIAIIEDSLDTVYDFVMFSVEYDDIQDDTKDDAEMIVSPDPEHMNDYTVTYPYNTMEASGDGLWDNIRKKKEREGKNYRPAKPGDKGYPDAKNWKKLTKKEKDK
jgi:hypothetical protein